jgi:hypothetical protein
MPGTDELRAALRYRAALRRAVVIAESKRFGDAAGRYMHDRRTTTELPPFTYQPADDGFGRFAAPHVPRRTPRAGTRSDLAQPVSPRAMTAILELADDLARQLTWSARNAW